MEGQTRYSEVLVAQETSLSIVESSAAVMAYHGRTFRLASWLLPVTIREDAGVVYAFCRLVDDLVDEAPSPSEGRTRLDELRKDFLAPVSQDRLVAAFREVCNRWDISQKAAVDLMDGVASDAGRVCFGTDRELIRYSYQVAGTVGLMMARLLGVRGHRLLPFAIDLGIAMQLTNICRDVLEDARRGRVYLPEERLRKAGTSSDELLRGEADPMAVSQVVEELLELAEYYYESGLRGLTGVHIRARTGIVAALMMYREIGRKLKREGCNPLRGRTVVGTLRKSWLVVKAISVSVFLPLCRKRGHLTMLHAPLAGIEGANPPSLEGPVPSS